MVRDLPRFRGRHCEPAERGEEASDPGALRVAAHSLRQLAGENRLLVADTLNVEGPVLIPVHETALKMFLMIENCFEECHVERCGVLKSLGRQNHHAGIGPYLAPEGRQ